MRRLKESIQGSLLLKKSPWIQEQKPYEDSNILQMQNPVMYPRLDTQNYEEPETDENQNSPQSIFILFRTTKV